MGFLHDGHLSLVRKARAENATLVVSIFVNPIQFGPSEDFQTYPRDAERDLQLLKRQKVDLVFAPSVAEVYPAGHDTFISVGRLAECLEGAARPGHFRGVTTVVGKLFNILQPEKAYFGQKDAQQAIVIRKMVDDLDFPIDIVVLPTMREADGLALSSRNAYLSSSERQAATVLSRSLRAAEERFRSGERDAEVLRQTVREVLDAEPFAMAEYVSMADASTLQELVIIDRPALASLAVRIGKTRLIDNVVLG